MAGGPLLQNMEFLFPVFRSNASQKNQSQLSFNLLSGLEFACRDSGKRRIPCKINSRCPLHRAKSRMKIYAASWRKSEVMEGCQMPSYPASLTFIIMLGVSTLTKCQNETSHINHGPVAELTSRRALFCLVPDQVLSPIVTVARDR